MYWNGKYEWFLYKDLSKININMRCIEMPLQNAVIPLYLRLTLTWDVLKYAHWQAKKGVIND